MQQAAPRGASPPPAAAGATRRHPPPAEADSAAAAANYDTVFTNSKAGMELVDKEHVKRVVYEASKGSSHFENEQRKNAAAEARIQRLLQQAAALTAADQARHAAAADEMVALLEAERDLSRVWLHVDADAFFASVEERDQPSLRGRPFAVGGLGMISTASYEARKYGVRSAMPGFIALKLCPQLTFVECCFPKYIQAAEDTRKVFRDYDPQYREGGSLDEASLDVTDYCARHGCSGEAVAAEIRRRVAQETGGLTCSVGIAPNRMLAKIASDRNKPNGQFALVPFTRQAVMQFMADLDLRKVPGVGKVAQKTLAALGIHTGGELRARLGLVHALFSASALDFYAHAALGLGSTQHSPPPQEGEVGRKGIGCESTFRPISARGELERKLGELAAQLANDMAGEGLRARTLTLKLKLSNFELHTRAATPGRYLSTADDLRGVGLRLLRTEVEARSTAGHAPPLELRLMGLRASGFEEHRRERGQLSLEQMLERRRGGRGQAGGGGGEAVAAGAATRGGGASYRSDEDFDDGGDDDDEVGEQQEEEEDVAAEPTLRDWGGDGGGGGSAGAGAAAAAAGAVGAAAGQRQQQQQQQEDNDCRQQQPGGESAPLLQPQQQAAWECRACTYANPRGSFWCEVCGASRLRKEGAGGGGAGGGSAGAAGKPAGKPAGKAKPHAGTASSSILRYVTSSAPSHLPDNKQQQGGSPGGVGAAAAVAAVGGQREQAPASPAVGEDVVECSMCGLWMRETQLQAHQDEHVAQRLQREEDWIAGGSAATGSRPQPKRRSGGEGMQPDAAAAAKRR